jgi:NADH-quinone oxidoreductase subunit E
VVSEGDPVIGDALRERIDAEIARFPEKRGGLLGALHLVQDEIGYVSLEACKELAAIFEVFPVEVVELVHFYNLLDIAPSGRHRVRICTNLPCALAGANDLLRGLEAHLGIAMGETTPDGRIHLGREECLGACGNAPMLRVDGVYHEDLDLASACAVLDALE